MPRPFQISGLNISSLAPIGKARRGPGMTRQDQVGLTRYPYEGKDRIYHIGAH